MLQKMVVFLFYFVNAVSNTSNFREVNGYLVLLTSSFPIPVLLNGNFRTYFMFLSMVIPSECNHLKLISVPKCLVTIGYGQYETALIQGVILCVPIS